MGIVAKITEGAAAEIVLTKLYIIFLILKKLLVIANNDNLKMSI